MVRRQSPRSASLQQRPYVSAEKTSNESPSSGQHTDWTETHPTTPLRLIKTSIMRGVDSNNEKRKMLQCTTCEYSASLLSYDLTQILTGPGSHRPTFRFPLEADAPGTHAVLKIRHRYPLAIRSDRNCYPRDVDRKALKAITGCQIYSCVSMNRL